MTDLRPEYTIRNYPTLRSVADLADAARQPACDEPRQGGAAIGSVDRDPLTGALVMTFSESAQWPLAGITVLEPVGSRALVIHDGGARGRTDCEGPERGPFVKAETRDDDNAPPSRLEDSGPYAASGPSRAGVTEASAVPAPPEPKLTNRFPWGEPALAVLGILWAYYCVIQHRPTAPPDGCSATLALAAGGRGLTDESQLRAFCHWHAGLPIDIKTLMAKDAALFGTAADTYAVDWYIQNLGPR